MPLRRQSISFLRSTNRCTNQSEKDVLNVEKMTPKANGFVIGIRAIVPSIEVCRARAGVSANLEGSWRRGAVAVLKSRARTSGVAATAALMARFAVTTFRPTVVARKSRWLCTDVARAAREMRPSMSQPVRLPRGSWRA